MARYGYLFIIADSTGTSTKRIHISRRLIRILLCTVLLSTILLSAILIYMSQKYPESIETHVLQEKNKYFQSLLNTLEQKLPAARFARLESEETFRQVWTRGELGKSPSLLGIGPISIDTELITQFNPVLSLHTTDKITKMSPKELPSVFNAIGLKNKALQNELSLTFEYLIDAERLLRKTPSTRPVSANSWITSHYGPRRDPIDGRLVMHKGIDLGGYTGMPVYAPADGTVIWTGRRGGYGLTVVIDHEFGMQTHFAHLHSYKVKRGDQIARGQNIGAVGSTGKSTGPHLHYEVRRNGNPINPVHFILD